MSGDMPFCVPDTCYAQATTEQPNTADVRKAVVRTGERGWGEGWGVIPCVVCGCSVIP